MSQNQVTVVSLDSAVVAFQDRKGNLHGISAEGALFKGGAALTALKDIAMQMALQKAGNGKYRAASDILAAAFPRAHKAFSTMFPNRDPWTNKIGFTVFVAACEAAQPGTKGWTKKQAEARLLVQALHKLLNAEESAAAPTTVEG